MSCKGAVTKTKAEGLGVLWEYLVHGRGHLASPAYDAHLLYRSGKQPLTLTPSPLTHTQQTHTQLNTHTTTTTTFLIYTAKLPLSFRAQQRPAVPGPPDRLLLRERRRAEHRQLQL